MVVGAAGAGWLGVAAVESGSVSGSGSGSRPGVLLRGPGGESCRIGLRPGTTRDFFPIASPSARCERREAEKGGARRGAASSIFIPRDTASSEDPLLTAERALRKRLEPITLFWLLPPGERAGFIHRARLLAILAY